MSDTAAEQTTDKQRLAKFVASVRRLLDRDPSTETTVADHYLRGAEIAEVLAAKFGAVDAGIATVEGFGRRGPADAVALRAAIAARDAYVADHARWVPVARAAHYRAIRETGSDPKQNLPLYAETLLTLLSADGQKRGLRANAKQRITDACRPTCLTIAELMSVTATDAVARITNSYGNTERTDRYTVHVADADLGDLRRAGVHGVRKVGGFTGTKRWGYRPTFSGVVVARRQYGKLCRYLSERDARRAKKGNAKAMTTDQVLARRAAYAARFRDAVKAHAPLIPEADLNAVVTRATAVGSGRVGRASGLSREDAAWAALVAHVRHQHTDYERILQAKGDAFFGRIRELRHQIRDADEFGDDDSDDSYELDDLESQRGFFHHNARNEARAQVAPAIDTKLAEWGVVFEEDDANPTPPLPDHPTEETTEPATTAA